MRLPFPDGQAAQRLLALAWDSSGVGPWTAAVCVLFPPEVPLQTSTFPPGQVPLKENSSWHRATVGHFLASCDWRAFQEVSSAAPRRGHLLSTADALHLMVSSWPSRNRSRLQTVPCHPLAIWSRCTVNSEVACTHHCPQGWHPLGRHLALGHLGHFFNISN